MSYYGISALGLAILWLIAYFFSNMPEHFISANIFIAAMFVIRSIEKKK